MANYKTFTTERLILRPTQPEDAAYILKLLNMPKWLEFIGDRNVHTLTQAENYIKERMLPQLQRTGFGNYTVIKKDDGAKIGGCGLYDREGLEGVDIGFSFLPEHEGKGYGYESAQCILNAAFNEFNLPKVSAITAQKNIASQKLIEKLGLTFKKLVNIPNDPKELMYYEIENPNKIN